MLSKSLKWTALISVSAVVLSVGGVGFLHTAAGRKLPLGRKLLTLMGVECPLGKNQSAEAVDASRLRGMSVLKGQEAAAVRPALGLKLDESTEFEALEWGKLLKLKCELQIRGGRFLKCREPKTQGVFTLAFNPAGKLVAVDVFRRRVSVKSIGPLLADLADGLRRQLGEPHETEGALTKSYLVNADDSRVPSTMKTAYVQYHFSNYVAQLTASYLPWSGLTVHEQYSSTL